MRSHAVLTVETEPYRLSLEMFGCELGEPTPEHHLLAANYSFYSYYGSVGVRSTRSWNGPAFEIKTMPSTGRGQTAMFDKLVGEKIAAERKNLTSARSTVRVSANQSIDVYLTQEDVEDIVARVQTCVDDEDGPTFFVYSEDNLGRYDIHNRLVWGRG
jgi:hypothetical protein